jgi:pSer/pThr/pTyr-binding forkhead associated (FHA) protein
MELQLRLSISGFFLEPFDLFEERYTVGRNGSILIPKLSLTDEDYRMISRIHCTLLAVHPTYLLVDGNNQGKHSENGLLVNGRPSRAAMLKNGDLVALSRKVYFELLSDEPIEFGSSYDTKSSEAES